MEPAPSAHQSAAVALQIDGQAFVDNLVNSVMCNCADGFDELDDAIRSQLALTPEQEAAALQGTAVLYDALGAELRDQLAKFERHALDGCLHVPAGLLAAPGAAAAAAAGAEEVDAEEEAAVRAEYARLRRELRAAQDAARAKQRQIKQLQAALEWSKAQAGQLEQVVAQVVGKENALAEDAQAVAKVAMDAERQVAEASALQQRQQQNRGSERGSCGEQHDASAAERDLLRRQGEMAGKPPDALQRIADRLAA